MRAGAWVAVAATVGVLLSLVGNMATSTVVLTAGWNVGLWLVVGLMGIATVGLALRQHRAAERRVEPVRNIYDSPVGAVPAAGGDHVQNAVRDIHAPTVQAGRIDKVELHYLPAATVVRRHMLGVIPPRADGFQDRGVLAGVADLVASGSTAVLRACLIW